MRRNIKEDSRNAIAKRKNGDMHVRPVSKYTRRLRTKLKARIKAYEEANSRTRHMVHKPGSGKTRTN